MGEIAEITDEAIHATKFPPDPFASDPDDSRKGVNWDAIPEKMDPSEIPIFRSKFEDSDG